jgi:hypothetical protein
MIRLGDKTENCVTFVDASVEEIDAAVSRASADLG